MAEIFTGFCFPGPLFAAFNPTNNGFNSFRGNVLYNFLHVAVKPDFRFQNFLNNAFKLFSLQGKSPPERPGLNPDNTLYAEYILGSFPDKNQSFASGRVRNPSAQFPKLQFPQRFF